MFCVEEKELNEISKEEAFEKLKQSVDIRNQMGGAMYWNILNDECCVIASKCVSLGIDRSEITPLLGEGNYR